MDWIELLEEVVAENYFAAQETDYPEYIVDDVEALKKRIKAL